MKLLRSWIEDYIDLSNFKFEEIADTITTRIAEIESVETREITLTNGEKKLEEIIEIDNKSLTHRPDLWSHYGFARELKGVFNLSQLKNNLDNYSDDQKEGIEFLNSIRTGKDYSNNQLSLSDAEKIEIDIENPELCSRFTLLSVDFNQDINVTFKTPSFIKERLELIGINSKNFLIDLSNYLLHDVGQPNHFYDREILNKLCGEKISFLVNQQQAADSFSTVLESSVELQKSDLLISVLTGSSLRPVSIAGVVGGEESAVHDNTHRLIIEAATFDPTVVRQSSKLHDIRTDSSARFEKTLSPYTIALFYKRLEQILTSLAVPFRIHSFTDNFPKKGVNLNTTIPVRSGIFEERLGSKKAEEQAISILERLGFKQTEKSTKDRVEFLVPHYRATKDISIEQDLVEEVGRVFGFENIVEASPKIDSVPTSLLPLKVIANKARSFLSAKGLSEVYLYSFLDKELLKAYGYSTDNITELQNPVDSNQSAIRSSLVPGMIKALQDNARFNNNFGIFEVGSVYSKDTAFKSKFLDYKNAPSNESRRLAVGLYGKLNDEQNSKGELFFQLKTLLRGLVNQYGINFDVALREDLDNSYLLMGGVLEGESWRHPYRHAYIVVNKTVVGVVSEVDPSMIEFSKGAKAVVAEIDLGLIAGLEVSYDNYVPLSKYPDVNFEISVLMNREDQYFKLESLINASFAGKGDTILRNIELLDVYEGEKLGEGKKSISVKIVFGSNDQTLERDHVTAIQDEIMAKVNSLFMVRSF